MVGGVNITTVLETLMSLNEYQEFTKTTVIYDQSDFKIELAYLTLGLVNEIEEVRDAATKQNSETLVKELGDVLWYLARLATLYHTPLSSLSDVGTSNLYKLLPDKYTIESLQSCGAILAGIVKKIIRDDKPNPQGVLNSLFDINHLLYVLAFNQGITLEWVAHLNQLKLTSRMNRGTLSGSGNNR